MDQNSQGEKDMDPTKAKAIWESIIVEAQRGGGLLRENEMTVKSFAETADISIDIARRTLRKKVESGILKEEIRYIREQHSLCKVYYPVED